MHPFTGSNGGPASLDMKKMSIQDEKGGQAKRPKALVIAGPSGVGKGTLIEVGKMACVQLFTHNDRSRRKRCLTSVFAGAAAEE